MPTISRPDNNKKCKNEFLLCACACACAARLRARAEPLRSAPSVSRARARGPQAKRSDARVLPPYRTIPYHTAPYRTVPYQSDQPTNTTPMDHAMSCQSEEMFRRAQPRARNSRSERLNVNAFRARRTVVKLNEAASAAGAGAPPAAVIIVIAIVIPHPCPCIALHNYFLSFLQSPIQLT